MILLSLGIGCDPVNDGTAPIVDPVVKSTSKWLVSENNIKTVLYQYKEFNDEGKLIELCNFHLDGTIQAKSTYVWDQNVSSETKVIYDETGQLVDTDLIKYTYDSESFTSNSPVLVTKELLNDDGEVTQTLEYDYDTKGRLIKTTETNFSTGSTNETQYNYQFNASGNLVEKVTKTAAGEVKDRDSLMYYGELNRIDVYNFAAEGELIARKTYIYNNYGNIVEELEIDSLGIVIRKFIYEYTYF